LWYKLRKLDREISYLSPILKREKIFAKYSLNITIQKAYSKLFEKMRKLNAKRKEIRDEMKNRKKIYG